MAMDNVEYITYGGVSIVNAIPAWLGGAAAVNLPVRVRVAKGFCEHDEFLTFIINYLRDKIGIDTDICIQVDSQVPRASGLKSNSAVAVGVVHAIMRLLGKDINPVDSARLAAAITKAHGSSITGAFDDASAAILGGVVLTDNRTMNIIKHLQVGDFTVVITGYRESKRLSSIDRLRALSGIYTSLFSIAQSGDIWRAATVNGILVAESLGYHKALETIGAALRLGALASGVSGNGPSVYAVFKPGEEGPFIDYIINSWGYYLITVFVEPIYSI
ncbi:shikimate kinase [Vulcanisaeta sp. EB80]|jgi:shikimate kinase|nr:MAG: shikimate kinase [Vulcanisaeta sp. MG_3]KUO93456.1 MAG: shikimate kinase [Vulcanisaeta sp. CIS_19]MDT7970101.1 shikimate kinase [Vulcanisaeta sp.]PLC62256.1 shikimate kinase [Vulcanisaeta sp. EB80]